MTKLVEWLSFFGVLGAIWLALVTNKVESTLVKQNFNFVLISPVIFLFLWGVYAAFVVVYRAIKVNDCCDAHVELQKEIVEAREDLLKKGFQFKQVK